VQVSLNEFPFFSWTLVKTVQDLSLVANALGNKGMPSAFGFMH
jgi:hypothetical protein